MKRIISVLFLSIFLFNVCGYHIFFSISLNQVRREAKMQYKKEHLEVIEIDVNDESVLWLKNDEMDYKGNRYDIFDKKVRNGKMSLLVFNDTQEAELHRHLDEHIQNHIAGNSDDAAPSKTIAKKTLNLYSQSAGVQVPVCCSSTVSVSHEKKAKFTSFISSVPVPPPDLA